MFANTDLLSLSKPPFAGWARIAALSIALVACGKTQSDPKMVAGAGRGSIAGLNQTVDKIKAFTAWTQPINMGPVINTKFDDFHPATTRRGFSLYISTNRVPGGKGGVDIWVTRRPSVTDPWGPPVNVPNINTPFNDGVPNITPDGHRMYFHSNRPGGCGSDDMYVSHRKDADDDFAWETPVNLGCAPLGPNTTIDDDGPTFVADEETGKQFLFYNASDPKNPTGIIPGGCGGADILMSVKDRSGDDDEDETPWPPGSVVKSLCSPLDDTRTSIRSDGLEIFFSSNRLGGIGGNDLWTSTRPTTSSDWSTPVNLGPTINTKANEGGAAISFDGTTLFFFSNRSGGLGGRDLYTSTRTVIHLKDVDDGTNEESSGDESDHN